MENEMRWPFIKETETTQRQGLPRDYYVRRTTYWSKNEEGTDVTLVMQTIYAVLPEKPPLKVSTVIKAYRGHLTLKEYVSDEMKLSTD